MDQTHAGVATTAERRVVTALFCDVVGSTTLAETMDPEDWSDIVNDAVATMAACVERYDGTMSQFAGDSILALFGAPKAHEDDPYRAVRAGLDIVDAVGTGRDGSGPQVHVRVGINTGLVVVGDVDAGDLNVYSALGDVPNVAARLQSLAEPDTVLVADDTYRLVADDVEARELGPTDLKGRALPVRIYQILGARGHAERRRGVAGLSSPTVGRDQELAQLDALLDAADVGTGRVAVLLGEPGVGKSRLVRELRSRTEARPGALWVEGHCVPYDEELPFHLVASLVRSMAGVSEADGADVVAKAVRSLAETELGADSPQTDDLLQLLGLANGRPDDTPETLQARYRTALRALVSALGASRRPLVLVCEDVHWADPSSAELVAALLDTASSDPVLLVLVLRPDRDRPGWRLVADARRELGEALTEIHLGPLDPGDSRSLVANLLAVESLPADLRRLVLEKAEGNPFFLEEVVRMLVDRGVVEHRDGRWSARPGTADLDVPTTVQGLLLSRIDQLDPEVRRAGRVAAVIGRRFPARLLREVHPAPPPAAGPAPTGHPQLAALERHGLVRLESTRPEPEYTFRHALIHDVMYEGMLRRERRSLHGAVAAAIERLYPDRITEFAATLARHHDRAGHASEAIGYLLTAGRQAHERGARVEAHRAFAHAVELLDRESGSDDGLRVEAVLGMVTAGMTFVPAPESLGALEDLLPAAQQLDDPDRLAAVYAAVMSVRGMLGEHYGQPVYRQRLDEAVDLLPRVDDPATRGLLQALKGWAMRGADEYAAAIPSLAEAVDSQEAAGRLADAAYNAAMLADTHATLGNFERAEQVIARSSRLATASGDGNAIADAVLIRGRIAAERGELEQALEHTREGLAVAESAGNTFCTLAGNFFAADQKLRLGEVEDAVSHLERSNELADYCDAGAYATLSQAWLTSARARLGEPHPADFDAPLKATLDGGSRSGEAMVRLSRAVAFAGSSQAERSFEDFERAIELFAEIGARPNLARAHQAYGFALEAAGRADDAATHLRDAEDLFGELGIRPDPRAPTRTLPAAVDR